MENRVAVTRSFAGTLLSKPPRVGGGGDPILDVVVDVVDVAVDVVVVDIVVDDDVADVVVAANSRGPGVAQGNRRVAETGGVAGTDIATVAAGGGGDVHLTAIVGVLLFYYSHDYCSPPIPMERWCSCAESRVDVVAARRTRVFVAVETTTHGQYYPQR